MTLVLTQQLETTLPIDVQGVTPNRLSGLSTKEIAELSVWHGRRQLALGEMFHLSGDVDDSETIVWDGNLTSVHSIGAGMDGGRMEIQSDVGRHVGAQMSSGEISVRGNASDYLGVEMTGGLIRVQGNAGNDVGGIYPGSKMGMNRGAILIDGDVGKGLGQSMRRGTIAVGGSAKKLAGWNMLAGTICIMGRCGAHPGAGMLRGTLVLAGGLEETLLPTFRSGGYYPVPVLKMIANWLRRHSFACETSVLEENFQQYDGDYLRGGRGEVFVKA